MPIKPLKQEADWLGIWREGGEGPLELVFKHSTRCPVSASADGEFTAFATESASGVGLHKVDIIADRELSLRIAEDTGVRHKSPQALLIGPGPRVVWQASHWDITRLALASAVEEARRKFS